jgi:hypothetical protein
MVVWLYLLLSAIISPITALAQESVIIPEEDAKTIYVSVLKLENQNMSQRLQDRFAKVKSDFELLAEPLFQKYQHFYKKYFPSTLVNYSQSTDFQIKIGKVHQKYKGYLTRKFWLGTDDETEHRYYRAVLCQYIAMRIQDKGGNSGDVGYEFAMELVEQLKCPSLAIELKNELSAEDAVLKSLFDYIDAQNKKNSP